MSKVAHDTPSEALAYDGDVQIDGPGGIALTMTPDAAVETGERLIAAAAIAHGQRAFRLGHDDVPQR